MVQRRTVENDSTLPKRKIRKARKPMSAEQKAAAAERLAIAREKRLKENPPEYKSIHPSVLERGDDDYLSHKKLNSGLKHKKNYCQLLVEMNEQMLRVRLLRLHLMKVTFVQWKHI